MPKRKKKLPPVMDPLTAASALASGTVRFGITYESTAWIKAVRAKHNRAKTRIQTTPAIELELWTVFEQFTKELLPKCKFNKDSMCNHWERMRRNVLFGLFQLVEFRSQDDRIREIFQRIFGRVSLKWMIDCCKTEAPTWYYRWAFDAIPGVMSKVWGGSALAMIASSDAHMDLFKELEPIKENLLVVKRVMES